MHVIWCASHNQQTQKVTFEREQSDILASARKMELHPFRLTALFKLSARNLCPKKIVKPQHRGNYNRKKHCIDPC